MKLPFRLLAMPALISALILQLNGCGEASNNLPDPVADEALTITACPAAKDICISGQFIDEPVAGLNYECNSVRGLTSKEGIFICPNNSVVTFFLQGETGQYRIILGKYRVKTIGDATGHPVKTLLQITPKNLVTGMAERDVVDGSDNAGKQVVNLLRLLQTLDSGQAHSDVPALSRIVITEATRKEVDVLGKNIDLANFTDTGNFETVLKPYLDKLYGSSSSTHLVSATAALNRFNQAQIVLQSGVYEVFPYINTVSRSSGEQEYTGMLAKRDNNSLIALGAMLFLIDRDGKAMGLGLGWQGSPEGEDVNNFLIQKLFAAAMPTEYQLASPDVGFTPGGRVKPDFRLEADNGDAMEITQGLMSKSNMSGSDYFYRKAYGIAESSTETIDTTQFGKWRQTFGNGNAPLEGAVNMNKTRHVSPYLDPAVWKTEASVGAGKRPIFPLHLRLTLRDSDTGNGSGCDGTSCPVGTMGITILDNGNIITDRDNDCKAVDASLLDSDNNLQEYRLGMVSAVLADATTGATRPFIAPVMFVGSWAKNSVATDVSVDDWSKFYGIQIGLESFAGGTKVEIGVANALEKIVTIQNQSDAQETHGVTAEWTNYLKLQQSFVKNTTVKPEQAQGKITRIEPQSCYDPQPTPAL